MASAATGPARSRARRLPRRVVILGFTFAAFAISYIDRVNLSVAAPVIMQERGLNEAQMGAVLSAFFIGFAIAHPVGGWLADRFGGKRVLAAGCAWWSLWTLLTPLGWPSLFAVRLLLGSGEGVNTPAMNSLFGRWFRPAERTRAVAFNISGIQLGTIIGFPLSTWIMLRWGWSAIFYAYSVVGFAWVAAWWWVAYDRPQDDPAITPEELEGLTPPPPRPETPWRALLAAPPVWALLFSTFCVNWVAFLFYSWLPTYLVRAQGFSLKEMGVYASLPYAASIVGLNAVGAAADRAIARGTSPTVVRKAFLAAGMALSSLLLFTLAAHHPPLVLTALLCLLHAVFAAGANMVTVNSLDLAPRHAGTVTGLQGLLGNIGGGLSPWIAGLLVSSTGSWESVFYLAAGVALACAAVFGLFGSARAVVD
ncbi:MAG TPA: MFS transporter [Candidatus Binatia bacterium]|nr:MFS transporter [Candidatus Binatia bacterium]